MRAWILLILVLLLALNEGKNIGRHPRRHKQGNETEEVDPFKVIVNVAGQAIRTLTKSTSPGPTTNVTKQLGENKTLSDVVQNKTTNIQNKSTSTIVVNNTTKSTPQAMQNNTNKTNTQAVKTTKTTIHTVKVNINRTRTQTVDSTIDKTESKAAEEKNFNKTITAHVNSDKENSNHAAIASPENITNKEPNDGKEANKIAGSNTTASQTKQISETQTADVEREHGVNSTQPASKKNETETETVRNAKIKTTDDHNTQKEHKKDLKPDPEAMLHGDGGHAHNNHKEIKAQNSLDERKVNFAVDMESALHSEGDHAHDHANKDHSGASKEAGAQEASKFDVDMEGMLHGGDSHAHEHNFAQQGEASSKRNFATDPESILHSDGKGSHNHDEHGEVHGKTNSSEEKAPMLGASDLDSMLHGGDSHAHEKHDEKPEKSGYIGVDPEAMLHGLDGRPHSHDQKKASADDEMELNSKDVLIGKLAAEDVEDYRRWKKEKKTNKTSGWNFGFSFISDTLLQDLVSVKNRYLKKIWGVGNSTVQNVTVPNTHDEA